MPDMHLHSHWEARVFVFVFYRGNHVFGPKECEILQHKNNFFQTSSLSREQLDELERVKQFSLKEQYLGAAKACACLAGAHHHVHDHA